MLSSLAPRSAIRVQRKPFFSLRTAAEVAFFCPIFAQPLLARAASPQATSLAPIDTTALVRRAVQHRLDEEKSHHPMQYLLRRVDEHRDTTKLIIETKDGDVARLIAINGKPISGDANTAELARLDNLAQHPNLQEKRDRDEQKDKDRVDHILSLLPDAYIYKLEGMVPCPSGQCYKLSFVPNPKFTPPDMESQILRATAGEVWIDQVQERLYKLYAHFISDCDFGFGIIGRLNKGSTVTLEQNDIGNHDWELTGLQVHITGKVLVFKSFSSQIAETMSHFTPAPAVIGCRNAIDILKKVDPVRLPWP